MIGRIKEEPEDFVVEEVRGGEVFTVNYPVKDRLKDLLARGAGTIHFTLVKRNWNTVKAVHAIASRLGISRRRMGFAGNKDKRAVTAQRCSAQGIEIKELKSVKLKDVTLKDFREANRPIRVGDLEANKFTITLRDCEVSDGGLRDKLNQFFKEAEKGLPNFFGEQRFGGNAEVGLRILKKDFEAAVKKQVSKNKKLRELAEKEDWGGVLKNLSKKHDIERKAVRHLVKKPGDYVGAIKRIPKKISRLFVHAVQSKIFNQSVKKYLEECREQVEAPLIGYKTRFKQGLIDKVSREKMEDMGLRRKDFKIKDYPKLSSRGGRREALLLPKDYELVWVKGDAAKISFVLPKGCYATTVLRRI